MRFLTLAALVVFSTACGLLPKDNDHSPASSVDERLGLRSDLYCGLATQRADAFGFVGECGDQLLFNSLRAIGCPTEAVDIRAAADKDEPGKWHRDAAQTCYEQGKTSSGFSRDMTVGLALWFWSQGPAALADVEDFIAYGEAHDWTICDGKGAEARARCDIRPNLRGTLYELRYRLGGADSDERSNLQFWDPLADNYQAHIQGAHLYLRGLMFGALSDDELGFFEALVNRKPGNRLFELWAIKFKSSDVAAPIAGALEDEARFPSDHLPDSTGRCTDYLWQRDPDSGDWSPCPLVNKDGTPRAPETYNGIDLAFLRAVASDALPVTAAASLNDDLGRPHRYRRTVWPR